MRITLESTLHIVHIEKGVLARVWEGTTEAGAPILAFIPHVAVPSHSDDGELRRLLGRGEGVHPGPASATANTTAVAVQEEFWRRTALREG